MSDGLVGEEMSLLGLDDNTRRAEENQTRTISRGFMQQYEYSRKALVKPFVGPGR